MSAAIPQVQQALAELTALEDGDMAELEEIRAGHPRGLLLREDVVNYARTHPESSLHHRFNWDDEDAAEKYRLVQAAMVVRMAVTQSQPALTVQRVYVSLSQDRRRGGGYRRLDDVLKNDALTSELLADAVRELQRVQRKYSRIEALRDVWAAIEGVKT